MTEQKAHVILMTGFNLPLVPSGNNLRAPYTPWFCSCSHQRPVWSRPLFQDLLAPSLGIPCLSVTGSWCDFEVALA